MASYRYYKVGGSLSYQHPTYVKRQADQDLYRRLNSGELCYVLNSRQMGKSSLRVQTMKTLTGKGVKCASIDLGRLGRFVKPENWFGGFVYELGRSFGLGIDTQAWWQQHQSLPSILRSSRFIEEVLLVELSQDIVIFIDEIDSIIDADFKYDFFSFIYTCYHQRVDQSQYHRLTFCLLGVATPFDLIQDQINTFSDLGYGIELTGFSLEEAKTPLIQGLKPTFEQPEQVLAKILAWTGGQPFLTQKLCQLLVQKNTNPTPDICQLVQTYIVDRWEFQDEHAHLKTIRNRVLNKQQLTIKMLAIYQKLLEGEQIKADNSIEQMELRLSGLVVKQQNYLQIYNRIYATVFDLNWVRETLAHLRPYTASLTAWQNHNRDEKWLLREQKLEQALQWATDKSLSYLDYQFLAASQQLKKLEAEREAKEIFKLKTEQAEILAQKILKRANREAKRKIEQAKRQIRRNSTIIILGTTLLSGAIATGLVEEATNQRKIEHIKAFNLILVNYLNSSPPQQLEALLASVKAAEKLQKTMAVPDQLEHQTISTLRQGIAQIEEYNRLEGHNNSVYSIVYSPDGETIASASEDGTVKLWSRSGQLLKTINAHYGTVTTVAFSPDGDTIASAGADNQIKLWSRSKQLQPIPSGYEQTLRGHTDTVYSVSWSRDGNTIASAGADNQIKLWSRDGQLLQTLKGHTDTVYSVSWSRDGNTIASAGADNQIKLWSRDGQLLQTLKGHTDTVYSVSWSRDGNTIASAGGDYTVRLWHRDGVLLRTNKHGDRVLSVAFAGDGQLATASSDGMVKLWHSHGTLRATIKGHGDQIRSLSFSPKQPTIATAGEDGTVRIWRIDRSLSTIFQGHRDQVYGVTFSPDGQTIATASFDRTARLWNRNGQPLAVLEGYKDTVWSVSFSPDGVLATASWDGTVKLWNDLGEPIATLTGHGGRVYRVSFAPDGSRFATVGSDRQIIIWSRKDLKPIRKWYSKHGDRIVDLDWSRDGQILATASDDGTAKLWQADGTLLTTLRGHADEVNSVSFSPDDQIIATASDDRTVKLWNRQGQELNTLKGHSDRVMNATFAPSGQTLATASFDLF